MTVYTKSMMEALAEVRGNQEDNLDEATGNEIKKYMKSKWGVAVKASKVGGGKYMRASGEIPNKFREKVIKKFMPDAKILDMKNIDYGNVKDNYVALRTAQWDELINEETELDEAKYDIYHKDFSSAMQHAYAAAKKIYGITVDPKEIDDKVASGPRKPSSGKTNKYRLKGDKGNIQIQVANLDNKKYELNMYKEEAELDEGDPFMRPTKGKEKVVTVRHKTSGKELEVTANSVKKYEKMGYKVVKETTKIGERVAEQLARIRGNSPGAQGRRAAVEDDIEDAEKKGDKKEIAKLKEGRMKELHGYIAKGMSAEDIAKKMGVDAKTIKALMDGYKEAYEVGTDEYRKYTQDITPGEPKEVDEASARADAMRSMRRDKKVDPADVDVDASDADVKAASKNILAQMRKASNLGGRFEVEFLDKKKVKVKLAIANAFIKKYESMRKPADKEKLQNQAIKSYKDLLKVLKAGYNEEVEIDEAKVGKDGKIHMSKKDYAKKPKEYKGKRGGKPTLMALDPKSGATTSFEVIFEEVELDEALPSHLQKHFDKDGNPKTKEGKAAWERIKKIKMKGYTPKQVKMAIGIAFDKRFVQGNMTGAAKTIEKIAKGLSDFEPVRNALRRANENTILDRIDKKLKERKNG